MQPPLFPATRDHGSAQVKHQETVDLFNRTDWNGTSLGPVEQWPSGLLAAARMIMTAAVPMVLLAGRDGILIYNDGYALIAGRRHPGCFGTSALESWPEAAQFNGDVIDRVFDGETLSFAEQGMVVYRNGAAEDVWFDLDYSPLLADDGAVMGVMAIVGEATSHVKARQALEKSREQLTLTLSASGVVGTWDWHIDDDRVWSDAKFATLYGVDPEIARQGAPISLFTAAIHADDFERFAQAMNHAMATGERFSQEYRLLQADGETRWILAEGQPVMHNGRCVRLPGIAVDITTQKAAIESSARSELAFRTLANAMPQMVWSTLPDGFHDYYNARWYEFTGAPSGSTDGEGWNGMFHEDDQERAWAQWRHSLETGDPYQIEYRLRHHTGSYRWVLGRALPVRNDKGRITRWYGTCTDIHDAKSVQAEREIVAHELSHRIKNIFSVLSGIISLSARSAPEARGFAERLRRRIEAMGRAHDFVRPHSRSSRPQAIDLTLFGLLRSLLEPYEIDAANERIRFLGEDVAIGDGAATPLALLLHELATNSVKYGALSSPSGGLHIFGARAQETYTLEWKEISEKTLGANPDVEGFGSRLMKISVEGQMGGTFSRTFEEDGILVQVTLPLSSLTRTSRLSI